MFVGGRRALYTGCRGARPAVGVRARGLGGWGSGDGGATSGRRGDPEFEGH